MKRYKWATVTALTFLAVDALLSVFPSAFWLKVILISLELAIVLAAHAFQNAPLIEYPEESELIEDESGTYHIANKHQEMENE